MSIREYFQMICDTESWTASYRAEKEAWAAYIDEDLSAWPAWMKAHPEIDFEAIDNHEYVLTLWSWDMCGE